ncbi:MAG: MFS transporter [Phycisphaerae bacterium]|nr:MFS transporter [Phycisphaerae bacterium]HON90975.1 MFS transporter [Sedimentisphaerales bacterium]
MEKRTPFPPVFWVANSIEVLERFAYYGIYMGFGIYMNHLGYSMGQLGVIQTIFLLVSYMVPVVSGSFADKFGFKKMLIVSYLAYLPSILLLLVTQTFSGLALTMLCIGLAAGIFKPLISSTVRAVTDGSNKTLGFGIFYAMVNIGGTFGPMVAGKLRAISWKYAFIASAIAIGVMLFITVFFYKEPPRQIEGVTLQRKLKDIFVTLSDLRFTAFLVILGIFFWMPFWAFFNVLSMYIDKDLDTARLYVEMRSVLGATVADFFSRVDDQGVRRILGETISQDGYVIMVFQIVVSSLVQRFRAIPAFLSGLGVAALGFVALGVAAISAPSIVFLGIFLFAVGEMIASPRIQEYITWIAPKEKAGLYMGCNFLATCIGGLTSGVYTYVYGRFQAYAHPNYVWYTLAGHVALGIAAIYLFTKIAGEFHEQKE